jgi:hypothetical protein
MIRTKKSVITNVILLGCGAILIAGMSGCGALASTFVPSLEHCSKVYYQREDNEFAVMATCKVRP